ncbi:MULTISPECIES: peptidoglycan-binding protein [Streptomyces]|uniref:peptidoglycan-binding protein n=1 Tax=Streptomyces TaxID=1883 RepID=UPI001559A9D6|nr:peptidoglycan-binding protein [Streptomyces kasugaensis]
MPKPSPCSWAYVTTVGQALVAHGFGRYYRVGPGPTWTDADTRAAWQRSLGFRGPDADGAFPDPPPSGASSAEEPTPSRRPRRRSPAARPSATAPAARPS